MPRFVLNFSNSLQFPSIIELFDSILVSSSACHRSTSCSFRPNTSMSLNSVSEDEMLLSESEKENSLEGPQFRKKMGRKIRQKGSNMRMIALPVLLSSILSVLATIITHKIIFSGFQHPKEEVTRFLPGLDVPICMSLKSQIYGIERHQLTHRLVGSNQAVFMPEQIYRQPPSNGSYEAWMKLFPS